MSEEALEHERGSLVTYVPQDPASALNPALRVGTQLEEVISFHRRNENRAGRRALVTKVLEDVGLPTTRSLLESYPHQLSGGQQQRIAIAMAIVNRPRLIVMDEPTTGLDVTTQARVLQTIRDVCREHGGGVVYVTHDLAVVSSLAIRVAVMYAGRLAEVGPADQVLQRPAHPYVRGLLQAVPDIEGRRELTGIPGQAPDPGRRAGRSACSRRAARWRCRNAGRRSRRRWRSGRATVPGASAWPSRRALGSRPGPASRHAGWQATMAGRCWRSTTCTRATDRGRCCTGSRSRSRPAPAWRWSESRGRGRRRWHAASPDCTPSTAGRSR